MTLGINFQGNQIVGGFGTQNGSSFEHGFLYQDGEFSQIDFADSAATVPFGISVTTVAFGINDSQEIVGTYSSGGVNNGFSLKSGTFTTRNVPGALQTNPVNLNDSGQVVGWYVDSSNVTHGYVMNE